MGSDEYFHNRLESDTVLADFRFVLLLIVAALLAFASLQYYYKKNVINHSISASQEIDFIFYQPEVSSSKLFQSMNCHSGTCLLGESCFIILWLKISFGERCLKRINPINPKIGQKDN